jgi:hypothetical protein
VGLKSDIYDVLKTNIEPGNPGENYVFDDNGKVDVLAQGLTDAIVKWVQAQTFIVTKLNASQGAVPAITPVGPGTIPMITVKVDDQGQGVDNPMGGGKVESMQSKVQLIRAVEV